MNDKFYALPRDKQDAIINGALDVFAANEYKKASMEQIADKAGVSKGLLFHYFENKKGLYLYLYRHSLDVYVKEMQAFNSSGATDFFHVLEDSMQLKLAVMARYPSLFGFLGRAYLETADAVEGTLGSQNRRLIEKSMTAFLGRADTSRFREGVDPAMVLKMIVWCADGYGREKTAEEMKDGRALKRDFQPYLDLFRRHFYKEEYL